MPLKALFLVCFEQLSGNHFEKKSDPELDNLLYTKNFKVVKNENFQ